MGILELESIPTPSQMYSGHQDVFS